MHCVVRKYAVYVHPEKFFFTKYMDFTCFDLVFFLCLHVCMCVVVSILQFSKLHVGELDHQVPIGLGP